jgi:hypothetical protein
MKNLVDENIISEKFLIQWFDKEIRLDKNSYLYDKKAEKTFRDMIEKYIEWLKEASSSGSSDSSDDDKEEKKEASPNQSDEEDEDD